MSEAGQNQAVSNAGSKKQWQSVYAWGGVATGIVLALLLTMAWMVLFAIRLFRPARA